LKQHKQCPRGGARGGQKGSLKTASKVFNQENYEKKIKRAPKEKGTSNLVHGGPYGSQIGRFRGVLEEKKLKPGEKQTGGKANRGPFFGGSVKGKSELEKENDPHGSAPGD